MSNSNTSFKTSEGNIDDEVSRIFKKSKGKNLYQVMEELKTKYKDDEVIDTILKKFSEKKKRVSKIAEKIRDRLVSKYPNLTMKEYLEKISEYKKKYDFDDSEMDAIQKLIFLKRDGLLGDAEYEPNYTEMSKALGFVPASFNASTKLRVPQGEVEALEAIKGLSQATRELHNQVIIQSLIYNPLNNNGDATGYTGSPLENVALTQSFDKNKINIFNFVHPVIAALFFPRFKLLDEHMLLAGIADIVYKKSEGMELNTQPEYELYFDIATDPAETACTTKVRPFSDLLDRCNVQTKLWESVLNLRQGKYYMSDLTSFILAIDRCKASVFDAADLAYVKDEGTILRKLFAAFSIRPTIVCTTPVYGITQNTSNVAALASTHITTIPMVTLRIPMNWMREKDPEAETINLEQALEQDQLYIHHKQLTVKKQQILYSRNILVFYIHRRFQMVNLARLSMPYALASLPVTMSQFEKIMETGVDVPHKIGLATQDFTLRSMVAVQTQPSSKLGTEGQLIIGCTANIVLNNPIAGKGEGSTGIYAWQYQPLDVTSGGERIQAMNKLDNSKFTTLANTKGTLIIYSGKNKQLGEGEVETTIHSINRQGNNNFD